MTPEQLLIVGKGMYPNEILEIEDNEVWIMNYPSTCPGGRGRKIIETQFNPLEDNNQMVEIMERLKIDVCYDFDMDSWEGYVKNDEICMVGKTINEAVCNAAYEYFK